MRLRFPQGGDRWESDSTGFVLFDPLSLGRRKMYASIDVAPQHNPRGRAGVAGRQTFLAHV